MQPLVLRAATPRGPEPAVPYAYNPTTQMNETPDGDTISGWPGELLELATSNTQSSAGSKTHNDDD